MSALNEGGFGILGQSLSEDFNVTTDTDFFIVSVGKEITPFVICISKSSGSMTTATVSFGQSTAKTDFLGTQTLSGINAAGDAAWFSPLMSGATPAGIVTYTAGEKFVMDHVVAQGAAMTADVTVWGFVNDA